MTLVVIFLRAVSQQYRFWMCWIFYKKRI